MSNLTILSRTKWHANSPTCPRTLRKPSSIHELFIHWPGEDPRSWRGVDTVAEEIQTLRGFQRHHQIDNGWCDIGYNHLMGNGGFGKEVPRIWTARGAQFIPAAQLGHNPGTISLCVLMGPSDPLTDDMVKRIRSYVRHQEEYAGHRLAIRGHGEVTQTECPGSRLRNAIQRGLFRPA